MCEHRIWPLEELCRISAKWVLKRYRQHPLDFDELVSEFYCLARPMQLKNKTDGYIVASLRLAGRFLYYQLKHEYARKFSAYVDFKLERFGVKNLKALDEYEHLCEYVEKMPDWCKSLVDTLLLYEGNISETGRETGLSQQRVSQKVKRLRELLKTYGYKPL